MASIIFLDRHSGWSWADLMAAPDIVVSGLQRLDYEKGKAAQKVKP
jgi:hypothetical protein